MLVITEIKEQKRIVTNVAQFYRAIMAVVLCKYLLGHPKPQVSEFRLLCSIFIKFSAENKR